MVLPITMQIPTMHLIPPAQASLGCQSSDFQHDMLESGLYDPSILIDTYYSNLHEYRHQNASVQPIAHSSNNLQVHHPFTAHSFTEHRDASSFTQNLQHVNTNPRYQACTRPPVMGAGPTMVFPPISQSFVRDIPPHILSHSSFINTSMSVLPQGVQNASVDPPAQSVRPLISFDSNASITAPLHFLPALLPHRMPPLSFPSPIQRAPNPHSHKFVSPYLLLPPPAPMQQGAILPHFQSA